MDIKIGDHVQLLSYDYDPESVHEEVLPTDEEGNPTMWGHYIGDIGKVVDTDTDYGISVLVEGRTSTSNLGPAVRWYHGQYRHISRDVKIDSILNESITTV